MKRKKPMPLVETSRLGGLARKAKLSKKRRVEIARKAARARWDRAITTTKHQTAHAYWPANLRNHPGTDISEIL